MTLRIAAIATLAFAASLTPAGSRAQSIEVSPVVVDISAGVPSAIITIKNLGTGPMRYQVKPSAWTEGRDGQTRLEPATDLAVFPQLFQLAPGDARKVRVGATAPPGATERTWRLMVEDLPDAVQAKGRAVAIRTRFSVPVFLAPAQRTEKIEYSLQREGKTGLAVVARNGGNVRARPSRLLVRLFDGAGKLLKALDVAPWYVLAGSERAFLVTVPAELCAEVRRTEIAAEKDVESAQEFPGGLCAPP